MARAKTVTIPVTFTIKELLELYGTDGVHRKTFYAIAQSPGFAREMAKVLREDFENMGGFNDLDFFDAAITLEDFNY